jgi:hypothetical protein
VDPTIDPSCPAVAGGARSTDDHDEHGNQRRTTLPGSAMRRIGYDATRLAGPGVFGRSQATTTPRSPCWAAVALGVDHIDTSQSLRPGPRRRAHPRRFKG